MLVHQPVRKGVFWAETGEERRKGKRRDKIINIKVGKCDLGTELLFDGAMVFLNLSL